MDRKMSEANVLGVGVVGCGGNGLRHVELYHSMKEVRLIGVCDVEREKAEAVAARFGVKAFTRVEELVSEKGLDAVNIVTPGAEREPAVIAAAAGKHVGVETPFAATVEQADRMIAAAERSGVNLMFMQTHRFYPPNVAAKALIDQAEIGEIIWLTMSYLSSGSPSNTSWPRWRAMGGGFFVYEGTHFTDQLRWLTGSDIDSVSTVGLGRYVSGGDGEDNGIAGFRFKNGAFGAILRGCANPGASMSGWMVVGTQGMIEMTAGWELRLGKGGWQTIPYPYQDAPPVEGFERFKEAWHYQGFLTEFREFLASIREGRPPAITGYDGRASTEAALAVLRSGETGAAVTLPLHGG
jgi:UDP-N-acetyl-2-amino-2-deoxyglucuronate dehydrogenase